MLAKLGKGQSLFEVVIAIAVSSIIVVALVSLTAKSVRNATFARSKTLASRYAEEATEWLRGERDNNPEFWDNVDTPIYCLDSLSWSNVGICGSNDKVGDIFLREVGFSASGADVIQADVTVKWTDSTGDHVVRSTTNLADWREQ